MRVGIEGERPVLFQGRDGEKSRTRRPVEHDISDIEALELRDDTVCAWLWAEGVASLLGAGQEGPEHLFCQAMLRCLFDKPSRLTSCITGTEENILTQGSMVPRLQVLTRDCDCHVR